MNDMSRFDERLLEHPVRERISRVRALLSGLPSEQRDQADQRLEGALDRAPAVLDHVEGLLEAADPKLVTKGALDALLNPLDQAIASLEGVEADPESIQSFDSAIEETLSASQALAVVVRLPTKISETARKAFGAELRTKAQELSSEVDAIQARLGELSGEQQRLAEEAKEANEQRRSELQGEFDRIQNAINAEQQRLDQLVPQFEQQFASAQQARDEEWAGLRRDLEQRVNEARDQLQQRAEETGTALKTEAEEVLTEVRQKRDEVVKLYGIIGDTGTAGAFAKEADHQKKAADLWRWIAICGGILTIILAVGAVLFAALSTEGSTASRLASLAVAAAAGGLTAYAARQSGHHRNREDESRRLELELTAFGPFMADVADPDKAREAYAERLFKGAERTPTGEPTISKDQVTLLQTLVESIIKVRS
jgi:hypothetical protein